MELTCILFCGTCVTQQTCSFHSESFNCLNEAVTYKDAIFFVSLQLFFSLNFGILEVIFLVRVSL